MPHVVKLLTSDQIRFLALLPVGVAFLLTDIVPKKYHSDKFLRTANQLVRKGVIVYSTKTKDYQFLPERVDPSLFEKIKQSRSRTFGAKFGGK